MYSQASFLGSPSKKAQMGDRGMLGGKKILSAQFLKLFRVEIVMSVTCWQAYFASFFGLANLKMQYNLSK